MVTTLIRPDIVVQAADGNIVALVEVKNPETFTAEIAAGIRRNMVHHGRMGLWSPFFLLVSQDTGYLWDQRSGRTTPDASPTLEFSMRPVVLHYLPSFANGTRLSGSQLELAVAQWLSDLARDATIGPTGADRAFDATDFLHLIRGGRVETEAAF